MKKITIIPLTLSLIYVSVFAHKKEMHQYITREAFNLLQMSFPISFPGFDEMENYLGFDENTNSGLYNKSNGDYKIVADAWTEDEWDIVYHYGTPNLPNYQGLPSSFVNTVWQIVGLIDNDARREAHSTITHFWNVDIGGEGASTTLTDILFWDNEYSAWSFTISENAMKKIRKYSNGNYVERHVHNWAVNLNNVMTLASDWELPGIVDIYNSVGEKVLVGYYDINGGYVSNPDPYIIPIADWYDWVREGYVYNRLGHMCHLLQDMSVTAHVHCTSHAGPDFEMLVDYFEIHEMDYLENYHAWTAEEVYSEFGGFINPYVHDDPLYYLMYFLNQIADHYADGIVNGDDSYDTLIPGLSGVISTLGAPTMNNEINDANCKEMYDVLIPNAIRATAGLIYWFAVETNQIDPIPEPNLLIGNVSLNGSSGFVEEVSIQFQSANNNFTINPDSNGVYSHLFQYLEFGTYDITFSNNHYYPRSIENWVINENTTSLPNITLNPIISNDLVMVSSDPNNASAFHTIPEAINYLNGNGDGRIIVLPGVYEGGIGWSGITSHIKIQGSGDHNTIIDCQGLGAGFILAGFFNELDIIENFKIINGEQGIVIENYENGQPVIRNNIFMDCEIPYYDDNNFGAGISCTGPALIENNEIVNCVRQWTSNEWYTKGGGIYAINNNETLSLTIRGNSISECKARDAGGIYCTGDGMIEIQDNFFTLNSLNANYFNSYEFNGVNIVIWAEDCLNLDISGNIFIENINPSNTNYDRLLYIYSWYQAPEIIISNNSFINNENIIGIWSKVQSSESFRMTNNIFSGLEYGITIQGNSHIPDIDYNLFYNNLMYNCNTALGANCIENEDPHLDPETHMPIWNSTTKSPCIDAGDPSSDFDPDGTPSDIGAIAAIPHKYDVIELPSPDTDSGWKWLSFPALDDLYYTASYDPDVAEFLLADILDPDILDVIVVPGYEIYFDNPNWMSINQQFFSTQGFKFHMNQAATLEVSGFIENPNTQITLAGGAHNWIGYFLEDSQLITDAFSQIWDDLYVIQHQHWCMTKINGIWYYWKTPKLPILKYGDMVNVRCYNDHTDFQWGNDSPGGEEEPFLDAEHFFFTEDANYIPIYVEFEPDDIPAEVGVFVDGECKGASRVDGENAQILAYIVDGQQGSLEFEFYYNSRSANKTVKEYNCISSQNPYRILQRIDVKTKPDAWLVSFRENSNIISTPNEVMLSNFPNPFNPTTTIAYGLPYEDRIKLCIYNVKGQLVKQLVSGTQPEGYYEVAWNGKDDSGKQVSSGIFYYRLEACGRTLHKKMLMLK